MPTLSVDSRDAAAYHLLSGQDKYHMVVVVTQLLTEVHGCLIKLHQVCKSRVLLLRTVMPCIT